MYQPCQAPSPPHGRADLSFANAFTIWLQTLPFSQPFAPGAVLANGQSFLRGSGCQCTGAGQVIQRDAHGQLLCTSSSNSSSGKPLWQCLSHIWQHLEQTGQQQTHKEYPLHCLSCRQHWLGGCNSARRCPSTTLGPGRPVHVL
jgi:hypothetical protein